MSRRDLLAALAALAGALLLEPAGAAFWDRDVALLAGMVLTAPAAAAAARSGWATPVLAQILGWAVIVATASPLQIQSGSPVIVAEGMSLSPWLALASPVSLAGGLGLLAIFAFFGVGRDRGSRSTSPRR